MNDVIDSAGSMLAGRRVLLTGGAAGIGCGIVRRFVAEGASVVVLDRSADQLASLEGEAPKSIVGVPGDVSSPADNCKAVDVALERFGGIDVVVGNAGIFDSAT